MDDFTIKNELEEHHSGSFVWALRCCSGDKQEAGEVLQTVYLKILQGRAIFSGQSAFKTWLFAVIRKTAADFQRSRQFRHFKLKKYSQMLETEKTEEDKDSGIMKLFKQKLAKLPQRQQQVLELVFYHDLTLEQAARVLSISVGSARKHYDRGKKRIRQLMEKSEVWDECK